MMCAQVSYGRKKIWYTNLIAFILEFSYICTHIDKIIKQFYGLGPTVAVVHI